MKASDTHAMVMLPQGMLCIDLGKHCSDSIRQQGFQCSFCLWYPRDFFLCVCFSAGMCMKQRCFCAVIGTDDRSVGENMCNHRRNFLQLPCHVLQDKTALMVICCHWELPSAREGLGSLLPTVGTGPYRVASHSSQYCTPLSVVRQTAGMVACSSDSSILHFA